MDGCRYSNICQSFHAVIDPAFGNIGSVFTDTTVSGYPSTHTVEVTIRVGFVTSFSP